MVPIGNWDICDHMTMPMSFQTSGEDTSKTQKLDKSKIFYIMQAFLWEPQPRADGEEMGLEYTHQ